MDYAQEYVATLHDLTDPTPEAPLAESAVVVPIAGTNPADVRAEHVFETLASVRPARVVVPLRAPEQTVYAFEQWVERFDLPVTVLWCNAESVDATLARHGLAGESGKGRDVWLGLGVAASQAKYVAVHDADATTYSESHVPRLLAPLQGEYEFVKGYYARVEDQQLYGRLTRLFVVPLLQALSDQHDTEILRYLSAFRYPLAGEFALTSEAATHIRAQRTWGLELGVLGDAHAIAGRKHSAQVDLGVHRHDHRPVEGRAGLSTMADEVGNALFRVLTDNGLDLDYEALQNTYHDAAMRLVDQYAADASFNGLSYDPEAEREQVSVYASSIEPPGVDTRLPPWNQVDLSPATVLGASHEATAGMTQVSTD